MGLPRLAAIEEKLVRLLVARGNQPIEAGAAADQLVDEFGLDPILKGGADSTWGIEFIKAVRRLIGASVILQEEDGPNLLQLTNRAFHEAKLGR